MFAKIPTPLKSKLPLTLLASPLLIAAAQPPSSGADLDTYGVYCDSNTAQSASTDADRPQVGGVDQVRPISTQTHVVVTSEREMSAFVRDRAGTALRLLRANPYNGHATTGTSGEAAVSARDSCVASSLETEPETLLALAVPQSVASLQLPTLSAQLVAQPLPDLSNPRSTAPAPAVPAPQPTQTVSPRPPMPSPATQASPVRPATTRPAPAVTDQAPDGFSSSNQSPSIDPFNLTPTTLNPTPFDGSTIQTLSARPDGNYRYISGNAENRFYTDAELSDRGGSIFVLKKEGNTITGNLFPGIGLSPVCVTGIVSGDVITGPTSLDLSSFSMINAGSALPPESCSTTLTEDDDQA